MTSAGRAPDSATSARRAAGGAGALLVVTVLAAAVVGPWAPQGRPGAGFELPSRTRQPAPAPTVPPLSPGSEPHAPGWVRTVVLTVLALLIVALTLVVARAVRRWLARRRASGVHSGAVPGAEVLVPTADLVAPALADGVAAASAALERDLPPGDAVVAAWVALEQAAERTGVVRDPAQTPTEFTLDLLGSTRADPVAGRVLLQRYLAARFSDRPVTGDDVAAARAALRVLAEGLGAP